VTKWDGREFQRQVRDECLSMDFFRNRLEEKVIIKQWQQHYNSVRPHSSLGNMTPTAYGRFAQTNTNQETSLKN
jgi:hypothetical protein